MQLTQVSATTLEILLVEDSPTDAMMTREALDYSNVPNLVHVVEDGERAMSFLLRRKGFETAPRPSLILLDINLPRKSGMETLAEIKSNDKLKTIPVVILSTSKAEEDVLKAYALHANCYVTKPMEFARLAQIVRTLHDFWFSVVTLPSTWRTHT